MSDFCVYGKRGWGPRSSISHTAAGAAVASSIIFIALSCPVLSPPLSFRSPRTDQAPGFARSLPSD
ncbi:hypothetical protein FA13DRAFT_1732266 [Coprinellus micaceus]|uniref:Uncharacterized protein n=1 Tax=Coprinellus micaceus TaxID=71717 RepID=A0A4Y7TDE9_COPMI|nr:hypothetical protein FA13DRAFT_1732266 [Coprinellus micaceus]